MAITLNFHSIYRNNNSTSCKYAFSEKKLDCLFKLISEKNLPVNISFDDGHLSDSLYVIPLLKKYDLTKVIFFVIAENILTDSEKWDQTQKIHDLGYSVGSHSYHHINLRKLSDSELLYEISESKKVIESCIGEKIFDFSLPYGRYNRSIIKALIESNYSSIYTTNGIIKSKNEMIINRWNMKNAYSVSKIIQVLEGQTLYAKSYTFFLKLKYQLAKLYNL